MNKTYVMALVVATGLCWSNATASAEEAAPPQGSAVQPAVISQDDWLKVQAIIKGFDRFTFFGDVRFRNDSLFTNYNGDGGMNSGVNLNWARFRLRLGTNVTLGDFTAGIRFASGTGQQVSLFQTESSLSSNTDLWIDQVYMSWRGASTPWLKVSLGKMPNPYFVVYTSDVMWDEDYNPEGYAENLSFNPTPHLNLFFNAGQIVLNAQTNVIPSFIDSLGTFHTSIGTSHLPWLFGEQAGVIVDSASQLKAALATGLYDFSNVSGQDATPLSGIVQQGNSRAPATLGPLGGTLLNNFRVLDATAMLQTTIGSLPLSFMGDYIRNLANTTTTGYRGGAATGNYGYQLGFILGKAADAHTWELAYFYKLLESDSTLADLNDADFGNGGTARRGHIVWIAYNLTKFVQFKIRYLITTAIVPVSPLAPVPYDCYNFVNNTNNIYHAPPPQQGSCGDINRLQVDLSMKF